VSINRLAFVMGTQYTYELETKILNIVFIMLLFQSGVSILPPFLATLRNVVAV
jgi:hypothetical protein